MKRAFSPLLKELLKTFPCVGIIGPRQCGKTTFLETLPKAWKRIDLEKGSDLQVVSDDPDLFFRLNPNRIAIDEAQNLPRLFPALRVAIDSDRSKTGRFVITGSSSPDLLSSISETLAGRIGVIEMAPFAWSEVHPRSGSSTMARIIDRSTTANDVAQVTGSRGDVTAVHDYWFRGGYPEPWLKKSGRFRNLWMDQYVRTYLYRDVGRLFPGLDQSRFRLFLQLLGGLSGEILNYSHLSRSLGVSQPTARDYIEIAHGTFLWRRVPAYEKNAVKRIVKHPKGYLRDSGLLHHLLRIPDLDALLGHPQMGHSWEGMVVEEIIRQLNFFGVSFDYFYYRTAAGAEVDLILEGDFGLIPVEIKRTQRVTRRELRPLKDFINERDCRFGLVINNDTSARLYDEKIVGLPFAGL
jgi:predicted AAA+ superfamily ATPase